MPTYEEAYAKFTQEMNDLGLFYHEELYHAITRHLGPSIHDKDAALVACSSEEELKTVREKFLIGKLGLEDNEELDAAIASVCGLLGTENRHKHRATFYYLLTAKFQKGNVFIENFSE